MAKIRIPKQVTHPQAEQAEQVEKPSEQQPEITPSQQAVAMLDSVPSVAAESAPQAYDPAGFNEEACDNCGKKYTTEYCTDCWSEDDLAAEENEILYQARVKAGAEQRFLQELQAAKDDYIDASIARREIERDLKAAKDRQKDALTFYEELKARGPVIPKPVESSEPARGGVVAGDDPNGWRSIPITELALETIKGLGAKKKGKKYQALVDAIPTLGALEDRRVAGGADGLRSQMPDGVGEVVAEPLEELHLNYIAKWNANRASGAESGGDGSTVPEQSDVAASPNVEAHSAPDRTSETPSATEWELWPDEKRHDWLQERATQISESMLIGDELQRPSDKLTAAFQSGELAYGRDERVTDCPYIPGAEFDDWLAGYFCAARLADRIDVGLQDEPEPEFSLVSSLANSLDDI